MRVAPKIELTAEQKTTLSGWSNGRKTSVRLAERACNVARVRGTAGYRDSRRVVDDAKEGGALAAEFSGQRPCWFGEGRAAARSDALHRRFGLPGDLHRPDVFLIGPVNSNQSGIHRCLSG